MPLVHILLAALLLPSFFLAGCASRQGGTDDMEVSAVIRSVHRCSRISPEINIANPPAGTVNYDVVLQDRADPRRYHGGGRWRHDGSGVIPEGGLTKHYMGACPPAGTSRSYQYVVTARDVNNQPLMTRNYIFEQE